MYSRQSDNSPLKIHPVVNNKLKHLTCTNCKHAFSFRGAHQFRGKIPLLLECGHAICEICARTSQNTSCGSCGVVCQQNLNEQATFSVNLYLLGLMNASQSVAINSTEPNIEFQQPAAARFKKSITEDLEYCSECGLKADIRCRQCDVFFCNACYAKIHGRALQNHQKVSLVENASDISNFLTSKCELHPVELIRFYCTRCEISACAQCLLAFHQEHSIICQSEKIIESKSQFEDMIEKLADTLQRVAQTEKKLAKPLVLMDTSQDGETEREKIEARLTQHFTYLHGVLQNIENGFISQLQERKKCIGNNINAIREQLKEQKQDIENAILLATAALKSDSAVNVAAITEKLEEALNLPCHLVHNDSSDLKMELDIDESVVDAIEEHCTLQLPEISGYSLARTDELPADYVIEPIVREEPPPRPVIPAIKSQLTLSRNSLSTSMLSLRSLVADKDKQNGSLVEGSSEAVKITHIKDPSCFYTQLSCASTQLANLQRTLEKQAATSPIPSELELNKMYLVQYSGDTKWYRGRVKTLYKDAKDCQVCDIFYVDYGNTEIGVSIKKMRLLSVQSSLVPIMAKRCALYDIFPKYGQWEVDANKAIYSMIDGISHTMMRVFKVENDIHYVDITKNGAGDGDETLSIRDALVYLQYGCFITYERLRRTNPQSLRKFFEEEIAIENVYDVRITHIESPDCIYAQKIGVAGGLDHLNKLTADMLDEYGRITTNKGIIYTPQLGMPCAALYDDGKWYRGSISNLLPNQKVEVFFVDFGDKREYVYDEIRRLHNKFMSMTASAFKISLKDVAPLQNNEWGVETKDFMVDNLLAKFLKIFVFSRESDSYKVTLYIPMENGDINFNALLAQEKLAVSTGSSSQFINMPKTVTKKRKKRTSKAKKSAKLTHKNYEEQDLGNESDDPDPFRMQVKILQALSPDCVYVNDLESAKFLKKLTEEIQEFYNHYKAAESEEWEKDDVCIAYSAKDKSYHRSKILEIISPEQVVVFLYDIAITETVTTQDLQSLHPRFATLPAQAFKVKLAGILPCGGSATWLSSSCEVLNDLINENQHSKFYISKVAGLENDAVSVELWVRETRTEGPLAPTIVEINSINRKLVKKGVALPVRGYKDDSDKVLAADLRQQLPQNEEKNTPVEVEWVVKNEALALPPGATSDVSAVGSSFDISEPNSESEDDNANADVESIEEFPLPPPLSDWIAPFPIEDDKFCAVATNVDQDCVVYLYSLKQNGDTLAHIDTALQTHFNGSKPTACDLVWAPKDMCIAQYHADNKWYRAKVLEVLENDEVKVIFVDYGNIEECQIGTLRKRVIMGHIPIQTTKCVVHGLIPDTPDGKWTIPELDIIHALLVDKKSDVTVLERKPEHLVVSMTLRSFHNKNLVTYLRCELGFKMAEYSAEMQSQERSQDANSEIDSLDSADVVIGECIEDYIPERIAEPSLFELGLSLESTSPEKGETQDCDVDDNNVVDLFDIQIPVVDLDPSAETSQNSDCLIVSLDDSEYLATCQNGSYEKPVDVLSTSENERNDDFTHHYKYINIPDDVQIVYLDPQHIDTPILFHARLDKSSPVENLDTYEKEFILMSKRMVSEEYDPPKLKNIRLHAPCCARYTVDGRWYRAMLTEVDHNSDVVKVQYVDFGNSEYLTIDKIHALPEEWLALPMMSFECRLWGVRLNPANKTSWRLHIDKFQRVFYGGLVTTKIKDRSNGILDVELYSDKSCTKLLYDFLLDNGLLVIIEE